MLANEQKLSLTAATKHIPDHPHTSTLWRWARQGLMGVRLEYQRVGRRIYTSREALDRFFEAVTLADQAAYADSHRTSATQPSASTKQRDKALAAAEAELAEAGF